MADNVDYGLLSEAERLKRIGALFCKAVTLTLGRQSRDLDTPPFVSDIPSSRAIEDSPGVDILKGNDIALLRRFARLGEFSPRDAKRFWGVSRTSAYRRLQHLERGGCIIRKGNTNAVRYELAASVYPILEQVKQVEQAAGVPKSP